MNVTSAKPDPPPNALHTAFTHLKAVEPVLDSASPCGAEKLDTKK
jgi:hypothetical protein